MPPIPSNPMQFLCAPDSFKGSLDAAQVLGATFFDQQDQCMTAGITGGQLKQIAASK